MAVDTMDLAEYMRSKGLQVFRAAGPEITVHCPFCPDGNPRGKGKLYLNTETWLWECKRCTEAGNRKTLLRHYGDEDQAVYAPGEDPSVRRRILQLATDRAAEMLANNDAMLSYLLRRGLSAETIVEARYGYVPRNFNLSQSLGDTFAVTDLQKAGLLNNGREFFAGRITIPYLSRGSVIQLRAKDPEGKYFTPAGDTVRLYNADSLADAEDVLITEGEFDAKIAEQVLASAADPRGRGIAVVGLPGANSLPLNFESYFTQAKRVYLGLDPDDVGRRAAVKIKELLGSKARIVELPADLPKCDWTEFINGRSAGAREVLELLSNASGKRLWDVADAAARRRKLATAKPGIKTGYPALDAILSPGMTPGQVMIPLANTGTGKTVFLNNLAWNMRSRRMLLITMEQTAAENYDVLRRIAHFHDPLGDDEAIHRHLPYLRIVDENQLSSEDFALLVEEYADDVGERPEIVTVDYLGYYARGIRGNDRYDKVSNAVMQLKAEAKKHEVVVIVPSQVNRGAEAGKPLDADDARDSGVIEETADYLLSLYRPDLAVGNVNQTGSFNVGVLKSRRGGAGKVISLKASAASLVIVDQSDRKAVARVDIENARYYRGETYAQIYRSQVEEAAGARQMDFDSQLLLDA